MSFSCDNCNRIYQNLAAQSTNRRGEWSVPIQNGSVAILLKSKSIKETEGHYSVKHAQFGPFTEQDAFVLKHIRDINRVVGWNVGLLCQVLGHIK